MRQLLRPLDSGRPMTDPNVTVRLRPLSERILSRLPGPGAAWVFAWALLPWANAGANLLLDTETSAVWEQRRLLIVLNYAALSFAVLITLWGTRRIAGRLEELGPAPFRAINNRIGPLAATLVTSIPRLADRRRDLGLGDWHRDQRRRNRVRAAHSQPAGPVKRWPEGRLGWRRVRSRTPVPRLAELTRRERHQPLPHRLCDR